MASVRQWTGRCLGAWGVDLLELTHTPITPDHTPIKEFILDNLLVFGTRKKWGIASSCGRLAIQDWMDKNRGPDSERLRNTIVKTIGSGDDFPTSVLIWHVATDICYYAGDNRSTDSDKMKKHKQMSRELSHYIMYLVFKSGVMLTANSQHVHEKAHGEIGTILSGQGQQVTNLDEKAATMKLFQTKKKEEQHHQPTTTIDTKKHEEPAEDDNAAASFQQKLLQITSAQVLHSPVVPRACEVAQELSSINDDTGRWDLIASVWSEMLFFTAPRCGAAFHYEHLSKGGEFVTHVLLLMKFLGPFLPPPGV
ncbi:hypothetical protein HU200_066181 [Digitaria exilis]|uniref:DUF4220 domain-containing protein n=1 Tax=Digitaria exilis TaxID=1010633 RepID=A0A835DX97_9POAL|nr:hypothetical protein HU200_066181 [Digitaria exilis]